MNPCPFCGCGKHAWDVCPTTDEDDKDTYFMHTQEETLHQAMDSIGKVVDAAEKVAATRYVANLGYYPVGQKDLRDLRAALAELEQRLR